MGYGVQPFSKQFSGRMNTTVDGLCTMTQTRTDVRQGGSTRGMTHRQCRRCTSSGQCMTRRCVCGVVVLV